MDSPNIQPVMRNFEVSFAVSLKNVWTNSRVAGDLRRHNAHVMLLSFELLKKSVISVQNSYQKQVDEI